MEAIEKRRLIMHLIRDGGIIALSIASIVFAMRLGLVGSLLSSAEGVVPLVSFIAGIFLTSVFTAAPATVIFAELSQTHSLFLIVFFGALGSLIGDYLIFRFVKDTIVEDIRALLTLTGGERFSEIFKMQLFYYCVPFLGAILIASPLPDELGVALLGISGTTRKRFVIYSLLLNALGILAIGLVGRSLIN